MHEIGILQGVIFWNLEGFININFFTVQFSISSLFPGKIAHRKPLKNFMKQLFRNLGSLQGPKYLEIDQNFSRDEK
jgi:hypothetical protein